MSALRDFSEAKATGCRLRIALPMLLRQLYDREWLAVLTALRSRECYGSESFMTTIHELRLNGDLQWLPRTPDVNMQRHHDGRVTGQLKPIDEWLLRV